MELWRSQRGPPHFANTLLVGWLTRLRGEAEGETRSVEDAEGADAPSVVERASPGLSALFGLMKADGRHSILDLGEGNNRQMEALAPYARLIRFIGLLPGTGDPAAAADPSVLPEHPQYPYDVVLAWGVLDRLGPEAGVGASAHGDHGAGGCTQPSRVRASP